MDTIYRRVPLRNYERRALDRRPILADTGGVMEYGKVYREHVIKSSPLEVQVETAQ
jgi:hypothetical protein